MRAFVLLVPVIVLAACGGGSGNEQPSSNDSVPAPDTSAALPPAQVDWPGYFEGTWAAMGVTVQLWVHSDSTFLIRTRHGEVDTLPTGAIGTWRVAQVPGGPAAGLLSFAYEGDPPDHYMRTAKGLVFVDVIGGVDVEQGMVLEKFADEIYDEVPRMRLKGTFTYMADALSFHPCGAKYTWPCAGGEEQGGEEGEVLHSMGTVDLQNAYRNAVKQGGDPWPIEVECSLGMGPAMEGDGADEYIFIHKVLKEGAACP
jgi:hypothetical protein